MIRKFLSIIVVLLAMAALVGVGTLWIRCHVTQDEFDFSYLRRMQDSDPRDVRWNSIHVLVDTTRAGGGGLIIRFHRMTTQNKNGDQHDIGWQRVGPGVSFGHSSYPPQESSDNLFGFQTRGAGFGYYAKEGEVESIYLSRLGIAVPNWFTIALLAIVPVLAIRNWRRKAREKRRICEYCCPKCGYDLRAHGIGDKCPECGTHIGSLSLISRAPENGPTQ